MGIFIAIPSNMEIFWIESHPTHRARDMSKRPTIADVARKAGVSTATVDRVINKRRRVKPATAETVAAAARDLNFYASPLLRWRASELVERSALGFVLQKRSKRFYRLFEESLKASASDASAMKREIKIRFVEELSPAAIVNAMEELASEVDAIGVVSLEHPHVNDAVTRLRNQQVPTIALLSGISSPDLAGFIGIDGRKAGRCAAWAIEKCARPRSSVAVMIGSHRYSSHEDREGGLRSYFREHGADFNFPPAITYFDNDEGAYACTLELLKKQPGLGAVYVIGGGAAGTIRALREDGRVGQVTVACHELSPETRDALIDSTACMVIDTPIDAIAETAVRNLSELRSNDRQRAKSEILPFRIFLSENI